MAAQLLQLLVPIGLFTRASASVKTGSRFEAAYLALHSIVGFAGRFSLLLRSEPRLVFELYRPELGTVWDVERYNCKNMLAMKGSREDDKGFERVVKIRSCPALYAWHHEKPDEWDGPLVKSLVVRGSVSTRWDDVTRPLPVQEIPSHPFPRPVSQVIYLTGMMGLVWAAYEIGREWKKSGIDGFLPPEVRAEASQLWTRLTANRYWASKGLHVPSRMQPQAWQHRVGRS